VVAVLDSGIDASHPDLVDALVAERCFCRNGDGTGCCPDGSEDQSGSGSARDDHGHGSNVSGIIVSNGTLAPRGIAPGASVVAVRVLDAENSFSSTTQILSALDWIITSRPDVDVVNMSLGTSQRFEGTCDDTTAWTGLLASAIDTLRARGTPCFVSAGNEADLGAMGAPACIASSIAVGAVYDEDIGTVTFDACEDATSAPDRVTCFSNAGTALDLLAPGAAITSTSRTSGPSTFFGTSQAAPHAAGGAALLLSKNAGLSVDEIENALESTGTPVTDHRTGGVHPRLTLVDAIRSVPGAGGCVTTDTVLCIGSRFTVSVDFSTTQGGGREGKGTASSAAPIGYSRGGLFWFFDSENPEMLVKVLDGCSFNGHYWFFASAGTNVGYTITVTDSREDMTRTYSNLDLQPAQPIQDTTAFATCP
jgi:subtilisin family serine protease